MLRYFFLSIILIFPLFGLGQNRTNIISWSKDYKIQWDDFQGESDTSKASLSSCFNQIEFGFRAMKDNILIVIITNNFYKKESMKAMGRMNAYGIANQVLQQQQIYCDIDEVYARKFRKKIQELLPRAKRRNSEWIIAKGERIKRRIIKECIIEEKSFTNSVNYNDLQSIKEGGMLSESDIRHIEKIQDDWRKRVDNELQSLDLYWESTITLTVKRNTVM